MRILPIERFKQVLPGTTALIKTLVEMESPSNDKGSVDRVGRHMAQELSDLAGGVQLIPQAEAGSHLISRWGTGQGGILLLAHMDTVFDVGTLARQPFYEAGGKLFGPGVSDMKASLAMLVSILRVFSEQGVWPGQPITVLLTSDEETGSLTSRPVIEAEAQRAGMVFCLEPALANGAVKTARKGTGDINLHVTGKAAHAGIDHAQGRNAIEELALHILAAQRLTDYSRGTTVNVGVVSGGTRGNVVPDAAQALIDFRVSDLEEYHRLERWARALTPVIPGTGLHVEIELNRPPMPRDGLMAQTFAQAQQIAGAMGLTLTEGSTGGGSDANFVAPLGIPVLDGVGAVGDGAHSEREFIWVESIAERSALLANLLLNWSF